MRDEEFRAWLQENGANSQNGRNTRAYAVRKIESAMAELGSPHGDLETAWEADEFAQLRARLKEIKSDAQAGGKTIEFSCRTPKTLPSAFQAGGVGWHNMEGLWIRQHRQTLS